MTKSTVAAYVVQSLPLTTVRWLVIVVSIYAGMSMLLARGGEGPATKALGAEA